MLINQFLESIHYQFNSSEPYCWKAFGKNARHLDLESSNGNNSISCVFDSNSLIVYQVEIFFFQKSYFKWVQEDYLQKSIKEHQKNKADFYSVSDLYKWTLIDNEQDILKKINTYFKILNKHSVV